MTSDPREHFELRGQKALVTGGSGFIGSHLCARLSQMGAEVHAVSRLKRSDEASDIKWWQGDLSDTAIVHKLLRTIQPEIVFHLASEVTGARGPEFVLPTFRSNLISTLNILTAAKEVGCRRIIVTGSLEEPDSVGRENIPCSPYAAAKWAAGAYARMFHALYQLPVVILRVFMVYGPAQRDIKKLVPYVILSLLRGEKPKLSNGQRPIDWIFVSDVVEAFIAAAKKPGIDGYTIDVGSGELVTIRAVVEQLVRLIDPRIEPLFGALESRPFEQVRVADSATSYTTLGWKVVTPLESGLQRTVEWYGTQMGRRLS
jgi:nucleoside-diphosphate-sugar epimerase